MDCDAYPKVQKYFDARVQPSFLALINGGEIARINHYNFEKLGMQLEQITNLHQDGQLEVSSSSGATWERFYDEFDKWARYGEYDRDSMKLQIESQSDIHRGPGTNNL